MFTSVWLFVNKIKLFQTLKNTEGAIKNGQSRENQQIFSKSSTLTIHHGFFHPPITILHMKQC
jgi:hypothetical protein